MENKEQMPRNLCRTCINDFATCDAKNIVFSIDRNPTLRGELADMVVDCDSHVDARSSVESETHNTDMGHN